MRQSGLGLAQYGRISKHGRSHARAMLVEAARSAAKRLVCGEAPGLRRRRLVCGEGARTAQSLLSAHPQQAWPSGRSRGGRPQAHDVECGIC
ncbi:hypothetical protein [Mesorhizobium sp.]|uniref:hypothetical protein n=1 Tax=Mesorhizobium sp. TaxID=1871066 RepID=UPI00338FB28F